MVETQWPELAGKEVRYHDHTWELTGRVDVRGTGEVLAVEARQADGVGHDAATLRFGIENPPGSLNPGDLGDHFDRLERDGDRYHLVVEREARRYRYALRGLEYR